MMKTTKNTKNPTVVTKSITPEIDEKQILAKAPIPRVLEANKTIINTNKLPINPTPEKNQKYTYDTLGNVQGFNIASKNIITEDDTIEERNKKILAQQASLPCNGPKPRIKK